MYFAIVAIDRPGATDVRTSTRPAHREYLGTPHPGVTYRLGGPLLAPDGATMIGSLIVIEAPDLVTAERFSAGDPYRKADLFAEVSVRPWDWGSGNPDKG
ncbi:MULTISPECIES: YciI family protein [Cupriavidus]|uniref:YCII-related protein n=1 Tax=Cupriavidus pinatubonensis (strain JMP 134 / LMG 1197) TaxID=264198 RepID=Q471T0_CUPPJ|nr:MULTISPECIES: YciI family protein [Cupriavidus]QYY33043.1 YciI family protein [Cupriavidus pinatubonensis]TPQ39137.1 YciI family protein [Cupriavidus pinatubonensis]